MSKLSCSVAGVPPAAVPPPLSTQQSTTSNTSLRDQILYEP